MTEPMSVMAHCWGLDVGSDPDSAIDESLDVTGWFRDALLGEVLDLAMDGWSDVAGLDVLMATARQHGASANVQHLAQQAAAGSPDVSCTVDSDSAVGWLAVNRPGVLLDGACKYLSEPGSFGDSYFTRVSALSDPADRTLEDALRAAFSGTGALRLDPHVIEPVRALWRVILEAAGDVTMGEVVGLTEHVYTARCGLERARAYLTAGISPVEAEALEAQDPPPSLESLATLGTLLT